MSTKPPKPTKPKAGPAAGLLHLPKVDKIMRLPEIEKLYSQSADEVGGQGPLPRWAVLEAVRSEIGRLRRQLTADPPPAVDEKWAAVAPQADKFVVDAGRIERAALALLRPTLRRVINATGVVLHTNLGRAPLPETALQRIAELGGGYLTLEYRLAEGQRGSRQEHTQALLKRLTGAEASLVVNNNAAAVLLMLAGLCAGGEVVVSRGELVEIGGSFRVPDVMRASGARLREVGTTNRTHLRDFAAAIAAETRALLKVHRSNFAIVGFTAEVPVAELARCAHDAGLLCLYDLGSGALDAAAGLSPGEPTIAAALAAGCDVVSFSCDKLLGGPQAGVLCGTRAAIEPLRQHPLLRALRPDKLTLLSLHATLELYRDGRLAEIPTQAMLRASPILLLQRAERLAALCTGAGLTVDVLPTRSAAGGGALPLFQPESYAVAPRCDAAHARRIEAALRHGPELKAHKEHLDEAPPRDPPEPAVVARLADDRLLCDVRTVSDRELPELARALAAAALSTARSC